MPKKPASVNGLNNQFNEMIQISHFRTKADAVHFSATLDKSTIHLLESLSFFFFLAVLFVPSVFICTSYFPRGRSGTNDNQMGKTRKRISRRRSIYHGQSLEALNPTNISGKHVLSYFLCHVESVPKLKINKERFSVL